MGDKWRFYLRAIPEAQAGGAFMVKSGGVPHGDALWAPHGHGSENTNRALQQILWCVILGLHESFLILTLFSIFLRGLWFGVCGVCLLNQGFCVKLHLLKCM